MAEILEKKDIEPLVERLVTVELMLYKIFDKITPPQAWFSREDLCKIKNMNINTIKKKKDYIWPDGPQIIAGRIQYHITKVIPWLLKSDDQLFAEYIARKEKKKKKEQEGVRDNS